MVYKRLGSVTLSDTYRWNYESPIVLDSPTSQVVYTVPSGKTVVVSRLAINNQDLPVGPTPATEQSFKVYVYPGSSPLDTDKVYEGLLSPNDTFEGMKGFTLSSGDKVSIYADGGFMHNEYHRFAESVAVNPNNSSPQYSGLSWITTATTNSLGGCIFVQRRIDDTRTLVLWSANAATAGNDYQDIFGQVIKRNFDGTMTVGTSSRLVSTYSTAAAYPATGITDCIVLDNGSAVFSHCAGTNNPAVAICRISGMDVTYITNSQLGGTSFTGSNNTITLAKIGTNKGMAVWSVGTNNPYARAFTVSNNTFTFGATANIEASGSAYVWRVNGFRLADDKVLAVFRDSANLNYESGRVLTVSGVTITTGASKFVISSTDNYPLAIAGGKYTVGTDTVLYYSSELRLRKINISGTGLGTLATPLTVPAVCAISDYNTADNNILFATTSALSIINAPVGTAVFTSTPVRDYTTAVGNLFLTSLGTQKSSLQVLDGNNFWIIEYPPTTGTQFKGWSGKDYSTAPLFLRGLKMSANLFGDEI